MKKILQLIVQKYIGQLYANKLNNLQEIKTFLENIKPIKTESGRNRKPEQTNNE